MIFIAIANLMIILVGLVFAAVLVREMTIWAVERGSYWREPKKEESRQPRIKEQARDSVIGRMGFTGRGAPIRVLPPAAPQQDIALEDEGCSYCIM